jgi:EpsI family protein
MRFEHDRWHIVLGYVVFGVILLLLLQVGARYRDARVPARTIPAWSSTRPGLVLRSMTPVLAACAVIALAPLFTARIAAIGGSPQMMQAMSKPMVAADGWALRELPSAWRPSISGGSARAAGIYAGEGGNVEVFVEVFPLPSETGAEMISYHNSIQPDSNDRLYTDRTRTIALGGDGGHVTVRETVVSRSRPRLVWYWYDVAGQPAVGGVRAKLLEALSLLRHGRGAQRIVVLSTEIDSPASAAERLTRFVEAHVGQLGVREAVR